MDVVTKVSTDRGQAQAAKAVGSHIISARTSRSGSMLFIEDGAAIVRSVVISAGGRAAQLIDSSSVGGSAAENQISASGATLLVPQPSIAGFSVTDNHCCHCRPVLG